MPVAVRPLLLVLDNLHWCDHGLLRLWSRAVLAANLRAVGAGCRRALVRATDRAVAHRRAAEALARTGSSPVRAAEQLTAALATDPAVEVADGWAVAWLAERAADLMARPERGGDLGGRVLASGLATREQRRALSRALVGSWAGDRPVAHLSAV